MKKKYSLFTLLVGTCLCSLSAYAVPTDIATPITQEINQKSKKQIKGTVLDENEEPVIGATVVVIGVAGGGITDMDGKFTLSAFPNQELKVSYLGYQNARIKVTDKSTYVIRMKPKIDELEEVTVVAFAKQKKESVIASVSTIKPAELKSPPVTLLPHWQGVCRESYLTKLAVSRVKTMLSSLYVVSLPSRVRPVPIL